MLNSQVEILKPVVGFEGLYQVSNLGYITNGRKTLKTYTINSGYQAVKLTKNGVRKSVLVHRIVAIHFVDNGEEKPEVNHIDGSKTNNRADNLEWVTSAENKEHARVSNLWSYNRPSTGVKLGKSSMYRNVIWDKVREKWIGVVRYDSRNHFPKRFDCEKDAALHVNWVLDTLGLKDRPRNNV